MTKPLIVFHYNPNLIHQIEHASWFDDCLKPFDIRYMATPNIHAPGDIHIISGPHYALDYWHKHPNVLMIDRAYLPNHQIASSKWKSEEWLSIGWLNPEGDRDYPQTMLRDELEIAERPISDKTVFLADYDGPVCEADTIRWHPVEKTSDESLHDCLRRHYKAIGFRTTAFISAALEGLEIECLNSSHILNKPNWQELLKFTDWNFNDIQSGEAWAHLRQLRLR